MTLQGHLTDYPLSLLFAILDNRRETGQLRVDFESAPGMFHFKDGKLIGATVGPLKGLPAVRVAFLLAEASFRFDLTEGAGIDEEASINDADRKEIVTRLLGIRAPDANEGGADLGESLPGPVSTNTSRDFPQPSGGPAIPSMAARMLLTAEDALMYLRCHVVLATATVVLLITVPGVIALTVNFGTYDGPAQTPVIAQGPSLTPQDPAKSSQSGSFQAETMPSTPVDFGSAVEDAVTTPEPAPPKVKRVLPSVTRMESSPDQEPVKVNAQSRAASPKTISVVIQIEAGRVSEAYVKDHQPGSEAFEATAIRLARHRRYSKDKSGTDTISVKVSVDR